MSLMNIYNQIDAYLIEKVNNSQTGSVIRMQGVVDIPPCRRTANDGVPIDRIHCNLEILKHQVSAYF